jgi:hypothetical protein
MKSRVRTCDQCRKKIAEEVRKQCALWQYEMFRDIVEDVVRASATAMIAVLDRRELSKNYIQKFFDDLVFVLDYPEIYGKKLESLEMQEYFAEKYAIDFNRIKAKCETKQEFMHREKIR